MTAREESDRHLVLGSGERDSEALLEARDGIESGLLLDLGAFIAGQ